MNIFNQISKNLSPNGLPNLFQPSEVFSINILYGKMTPRESMMKFDSCRALGHFKEYVQVYSAFPLVLTYFRVKGNLWQIGNYYKMDQDVEFLTLGMKIPMSTIYEGIEFEDENLPQL